MIHELPEVLTESQMGVAAAAYRSSAETWPMDDPGQRWEPYCALLRCVKLPGCLMAAHLLAIGAECCTRAFLLLGRSEVSDLAGMC